MDSPTETIAKELMRKAIENANSEGAAFQPAQGGDALLKDPNSGAGMGVTGKADVKINPLWELVFGSPSNSNSSV
ncbi:hypothetical protein AX774_g5122 [Zancudomyces culisetae]|uniref:Uncharacterized protein n=1 Tax=Zancudomyces culisetae TaxID=1213189 RepID=A0A1R1PKB8_ZANCU|nr:hypothetical protein AX774_g5122 [Zancudomyces culisetae]|eukprot:OMH81418.1 hypothetical protein AX774_g5122 [Zancudomyces culisetae]